MKTSPKFKRNVLRIIPFGIIWLLLAWLYIVTETIATRNQHINPETDIQMTLPVFVFASTIALTMGLLVGAIEILVFEKRFSGYGLTRKVLTKLSIYFSFTVLMLLIGFPIGAMVESGEGLFSQRVLGKTMNFFLSLTLLNTLIQIAFSFLVALLYSAVSENLGYHVLINLVSGKYHRPVVEKRIFMFLDMKSSTTIAEKLGHVAYFSLLEDYYDAMSNAIINSLGEVYQYIGDEVVISWTFEKGIEDANCLRCFFDIEQSMQQRKERFTAKFGIVPEFKAGIHYGDVTIGEIGALKREIVFTGDVLNTTSRIQGMCNQLESNLLISDHLREALTSSDYTFIAKGSFKLQGRNQREQLFEVKD